MESLLMGLKRAHTAWLAGGSADPAEMTRRAYELRKAFKEGDGNPAQRTIAAEWLEEVDRGVGPKSFDMNDGGYTYQCIIEPVEGNLSTFGQAAVPPLPALPPVPGVEK
jgi:hypothetical protein